MDFSIFSTKVCEKDRSRLYRKVKHIKYTFGFLYIFIVDMAPAGRWTGVVSVLDFGSMVQASANVVTLSKS